MVAINLSIVVCTYNRKWFLENLLEHLSCQLKTTKDCELLIIDNNSSDDTETFARDWVAKNRCLAKYHIEPMQGLSYARNKGLSEAQGQWIVYLDDDAYPSKNWLSQIQHTIRERGYDAFGGAYLPWYRDGKVHWYRDSYGSNTSWLTFKSPSILTDQCFSGGNAVYRRKLLESTKGFPTQMGMHGHSVAYGEENYVQETARRQGFILGFDPNVIIYHYVGLKKQTLSWFWQQGKAVGRDYWSSQDREPTISALLVLALLFIPVCLKKTLITLQKNPEAPYYWQNTVAPVLREIALQTSKFLSGVTQLIQSRR